MTPDAGKDADVHAVIRDLGLESQAFAWTGSASGLGDEQRLLAEAWDLAEVEERYLDFLRDFEAALGRLRPRTPSSPRSRWSQEWRRFPFLDPDLPGELLDHDWPGPARGRATFHDRHARWHRGRAGGVGADGHAPRTPEGAHRPLNRANRPTPPRTRHTVDR